MQVEVEDDGVEATAELAASRVVGNDKTRQGLPTIFKYGGEAKEAYVAGTFSKWEKIPMVKSQKDFVALVDLPVGEHQFKYFVDQKWTHDQGLPTTSNEVPSKNYSSLSYASRLVVITMSSPSNKRTLRLLPPWTWTARQRM